MNMAVNIGSMSDDEADNIISCIRKLPTNIQSVLNEHEEYKNIAKKLYKHNDVFFIGRNIDYALAMEGSLKLKRFLILILNAIPAGELKHGTISLIEKGTIRHSYCNRRKNSRKNY